MKSKKKDPAAVALGIKSAKARKKLGQAFIDRMTFLSGLAVEARRKKKLDKESSNVR